MIGNIFKAKIAEYLKVAATYADIRRAMINQMWWIREAMIAGANGGTTDVALAQIEENSAAVFAPFDEYSGLRSTKVLGELFKGFSTAAAKSEAEQENKSSELAQNLSKFGIDEQEAREYLSQLNKLFSKQRAQLANKSEPDAATTHVEILRVAEELADLFAKSLTGFKF